MKFSLSPLALRLTGWFLLLSFLPLAVMAIFVRQNVKLAFDEQELTESMLQAQLLGLALDNRLQALDSPPEAGSGVQDGAGDGSGGFDAQTSQWLAQKLPPGTIAFVVDGQGVYLAHSQGRRGLASQHYTPETLAQVLSGQPGAVVDQPIDLTLGYAPLEGAPLRVVAVIDGADADNRLFLLERTSLLQLAVSLALISLFGGLAIWLVVGRPLQALTQTAGQIAAGELGVQVAEDEMEDELLALGQAFNQMSRQLQEMVRGLEQKVIELKQAEQTLQLRNAILSGQQETSRSGILIVGAQGQVLEYNQRFVHLWDIQPEALATRDDSLLLQSVLDKLADPQEFVARVEYLYAHQQEKSQEEVRLRDGRILDRYSSPMLGPNGAYYGRVWYFQDITDRQRVQDALRASEEKFTKLFYSSPSIVALVHLESGEVVEVNDALCRLMGYRREDLVGRPMQLWADAVQQQQAFALLSKNKELLGFECQFLTHSGDVLDILLAAEMVSVDNQPYVLVSGHDLTALKRAEREIMQLNANLERRVELRTAELCAANHEMESFAYSISHDLRAPLRAISGYTRLAAEDYGAILPEEARQHLDKVLEASGRMNLMIDSLLNFSLLGRQPLERQRVALRPLVERAIQEQSRELEERQVEWAVGEMPDCFADPLLLYQVYANLIGNALKYSRPRLKARIEIGWLDMQGDDVYYVRDNGIGFDMRYVDRIFGVFQRLHTSDAYEGAGIGLANVKRIIERHEGRVWAEGQEGEGAAFFFTLG